MKGILEKNISWNKIGKHSKNDYVFTIGKAVVSKETTVLSVEMSLNFIIPFGDIAELKDHIKYEIPALKGVEFEFRYEDVILTDEEIIRHYIPYMVAEVNGEYSPVTRAIIPGKVDINDDVLIIYTTGDGAAEVMNKELSARFSSMLKQRFGIEKSIEFKKGEQPEKRSPVEKSERTHSSSTEKSVGKAPGKQASKASDSSLKSQAQSVLGISQGKCIYGKAIPAGAKRVPLRALHEDSGRVVVEGVIFHKAEKDLYDKEKVKLVNVLITDNDYSTNVKFYFDVRSHARMEKLMPIGTRIRVRGTAGLDRYDHELTILGKDIEKLPLIKRVDDAEKKRVELHAHTKMSAMDGLADTVELVKRAAEWGHPAIAITDHGVCQAFPEAAGVGRKNGIKVIFGMEGYLFDDILDYPEARKSDEVGPDTIDCKHKNQNTQHIILLAANQTGLKNLYKLVSYSHMYYFYKRPRLPKSILDKHREGIIVGAACEAGQVYQAVLNNKSDEELEKIASYYDYLEIQPLINNQFLIDKADDNRVKDKEDLRENNRKIVALGKKLGKPVVATCDSHYIDPHDSVYRKILMAGQGFTDIEGDKGLYFRTTEEMLEEFSYLGEDVAYEVVINAPTEISDRIETLSPVPSGKFPPKIANSDEILRTSCMNKAWGIYGKPLPDEIESRLNRELDSIISNGYAVMYVSAQMLVQKSMDDGYLVGSRGSVGSSFAATMAGITEVNPLPPHYICPNPDCKCLEWGDPDVYDCGVDMPKKTCPECGTPYTQDGFNIPFETFLGFEGDKEPDIDLNFAGDYQANAHKYVEEIFGRKNVYRAGTIGKIAEKTAYGFVRKYFDSVGMPVNKWETERLTKGCTDVRRTTGQHPGGIIIVPEGNEIYEFCPVQFPANDDKSGIITTHFDYHSIDQNLLKLDILGHDVPSMIRHLQDITGVDPLSLPFSDEKVDSLFKGVEGLDIKDKNYPYVHGTFGIPEFGTKFVRQMLDDTQPSQFADLLRISGFSHGTDVWINNAQEFIKSGQATMKDAISTRDDIMNYLISKGLPNKTSFKIMESVRKGKGITDDEAGEMRSSGVPEWYIESCKRIKYMFPKAHAVAYVMMSYRIAWYKVYHPVAFYAVYFGAKVADFNAAVVMEGKTAVRERIKLLEAKINTKNATAKEKEEVTVLEVACEMMARGYEFLPADISASDSASFRVEDGKVRIPLAALPGVGENAAKAIKAESEVAPFISIDDFQKRTKANRTAVDVLRQTGALGDLPESNQISLF